MEEQKNKRGKVGLAAFLLADVLLIGAATYMIVMRQQDIPCRGIPQQYGCGDNGDLGG